MSRIVKAKVREYDESENDYGFKTLKKFIEKVIERRQPKEEKRGRKTKNRYVIIEPYNFNIVRFFEDVKQLGLYLDLNGIKDRVYDYLHLRGGDHSQLIKGYIIARFTDEETEGMDAEQFEKHIREVNRRRIASVTLNRIKDAIPNMPDNLVDELNNILTKIDSL